MVREAWRQPGYSDIEGAEIRLAFFSINDGDAAPIRRPHGQTAAAASWRSVVTTDSTANVEIKIRGDDSRLSSGRHVHHPEIRF